MEKPTICIGENKGADKLRSNCEADQRLCFRYTDSTFPLLSKTQNFKPLTIFCDYTARFVSDLVGTQTVCFLMHMLILFSSPKDSCSTVAVANSLNSNKSSNKRNCHITCVVEFVSTNPDLCLQNTIQNKSNSLNKANNSLNKIFTTYSTI